MKPRECAKYLAGCLAVALNASVSRRRPEPAGILVYHRTVPLPPGLPEPTYNVPPDRMREQLVGLQRCGYRFVALDEALTRWERGKGLPDNTVVLTFDDVFESVYSHAWPILQELSIPATLFLSTAYLDSSEPFPFDPWGKAHKNTAPAGLYRPIRVEQVEEMRATGLVEIGAHTHTHGDFRSEPNRFEADLCTCTQCLARRFGIRHAMFAYPFGRIDHGTAAGPLETAARRIGVRCALTTAPLPIDPQADPFAWGRVNVYRWDTARTIRAKLSGWYGWLLGWPRKAKSYTGCEQETLSTKYLQHVAAPDASAVRSSTPAACKEVHP